MTSSKNSKRSTKENRAKPVIILGGLAGSGKSTTAKLLARKFDLKRVSAGDMFRAIAKERKEGLIELGRYAAKHPEFDKKLDNRMMAEAKKGGVIMDGRATCYLAKKRRIKSICIWLDVDSKVSAKRVAKRDKLTVANALKKSRKREREIAFRLKKLWGVDTSDTSYYDVVIQTDDYTPKEVVDIISQIVRYGRN